MLIAIAAPAAYQENESGDASQSTEESSERRYELFDEEAAAMDFSREKTGEEYLLVEQPLCRFSTEESIFGTVYVWHDASSWRAAMGRRKAEAATLVSLSASEK